MYFFCSQIYRWWTMCFVAKIFNSLDILTLLLRKKLYLMIGNNFLWYFPPAIFTGKFIVYRRAFCRETVGFPKRPDLAEFHGWKMGLFENSVPNTVKHTIFPIYRHTHISYWFYLYAYLDPIEASWFPHASLPPFSIPINISHLNTHEIGKFPVKNCHIRAYGYQKHFPCVPPCHITVILMAIPVEPRVAPNPSGRLGWMLVTSPVYS